MSDSPGQTDILALQRSVAPVTREERERALARAAEVGLPRRGGSWVLRRARSACGVRERLRAPRTVAVSTRRAMSAGWIRRTRGPLRRRRSHSFGS